LISVTFSCNRRKTVCELLARIAGPEPPFPIALSDGRRIHTGIGPEPEYILHRNYGRIRRGEHGEPYEFGADIGGFYLFAEVFENPVFFFIPGLVLPPSPDRVVVVRAGVDDAVLFEYGRQVFA